MGLDACMICHLACAEMKFPGWPLLGAQLVAVMMACSMESCDITEWAVTTSENAEVKGDTELCCPQFLVDKLGSKDTEKHIQSPEI